MDKDSRGRIISKGCVVVDSHEELWFVEELKHGYNRPTVAKCRNGCTFVHWEIENLMVIDNIRQVVENA